MVQESQPPKTCRQKNLGTIISWDWGFVVNYKNMSLSTLPETNIAPENWWLEYYFPIGEAYFQVRTASFREGNNYGSVCNHTYWKQDGLHWKNPSKTFCTPGLPVFICWNAFPWRAAETNIFFNKFYNVYIMYEHDSICTYIIYVYNCIYII